MSDNNNFTNSDGTPVSAFMVGGSNVLIPTWGKASITSGDASGSIYRLNKIPANYIPFSLEVFVSANITSVSDADIGFYLDSEFGGTVVDVDALADAIDISTAAPLSAAGLFGLKSLSVANVGKTVATLLSDGASEYQTYDLALTINAQAGATGVVWARGLWIPGQK